MLPVLGDAQDPPVGTPFRSESTEDMMICKADFEELFPDLFQSEPAPAAHQLTSSPSVECTTRLCWVASARMSQNGSILPVFSRADAMVATMPAAAAFAAAWTMLSAYERMKTHQYNTL